MEDPQGSGAMLSHVGADRAVGERDVSTSRIQYINIMRESVGSLSFSWQFRSEVSLGEN